MTDPKTFPFKKPSAQTPPALVLRAEELRAALRPLPANLLAARTGSAYTDFGQGKGEFRLSLFDSAVVGAYPALAFYSAAGDELPNFIQTILLYYFTTAAQNAGQAADGAPLTGKFVSFADLPGGRMYAQAFQGYSGDVVARSVGENLESFRLGCQKAGGQAFQAGSAAYSFQALPRVPLQIVYWLGDEDFSSSCKILFDSSATHYLPIDGCAIIGSQLASRLIKALRLERSGTKSKDG